MQALLEGLETKEAAVQRLRAVVEHNFRLQSQAPSLIPKPSICAKPVLPVDCVATNSVTAIATSSNSDLY